MNKNINKIIIFLSMYLPFEDFILKWKFIPQKIFLILRQFPDLIVFSLAVFIYLSSKNKTKIFVHNKHSYKMFLLFICYSILLIVVNADHITIGILNLKALIRYVFIVYILYNSKPDNKDFLLFLKSIVIISSIQSILGILQIFVGKGFRTFFLPRITEGLGFFFTALYEVRAFGTMAYTMSFGFYLLYSFLLIIVFRKYIKIKNIYYYGLLLIIFLSIYYSGSRSSVFVAIIGVNLYIYYKIKIKKFLIYCSIVGTIFILIYPFINIGTSYKDFWFVFSPKILDVLEYQRLGMVRVFISYLENPLFIIGQSPDKINVISFLQNEITLPPFLYKHTISAFEDVYWIALFYYYGLIGIFLFGSFLYYSFKKLNYFLKIEELSNLHYNMVIFSKILILLTIPLNLFNQAFENRQFSFYLWTFIGFTFAIIMREYNEDKSRKPSLLP